MIIPEWHKIAHFFKDSGGSLMELLYPRVCVVCGDSLVKQEIYLCSACLADFPLADQDYGNYEDVLARFEENCRPKYLYSLFYYNKYSKYKNLIYLIKYHSHKKLGAFLGEMLGERIKDICQADCIIPVPLHKKRERKRGFNQANEIASGMSKILGIEIYNDVIFRVRNNVSQTGKNAGERLKNTENIFELRHPEKIRGRHVLLLDDVITTGATIGSCLQELAKAGDVCFSLGCLAQTAD